ncbi:MAG: glycosyltransferase [Desulfurivibrionaceae bacterium]
MNILMMTNTYTPHVGGVARSVDSFAREYRRLGHRVMVVAPEFEGTPEKEEDVVRIPAIQNFNGSDFSVRLPIPWGLNRRLEKFQPDIVHSHHPFLLGDTALRVRNHFVIPIVFTNHTRYEQYSHYVPLDSPLLKRFIIKLAVGYCNLVDHIFAPSESIAQLLRSREVKTPIDIVPTGVDVDYFAEGDGKACRHRAGVPEEAFVVGHVGRLAQEKNLLFLAKCVLKFMKDNENTWFLIAGKGPEERPIKALFAGAGMEHRLVHLGKLQGRELTDFYHAMDVFAFASQSETQGMVLTEAMSAGKPVVAVDASGVREVVRDRENGRLLAGEDIDGFAGALTWVLKADQEQRRLLNRASLRTAENFSLTNMAEKALAIYEDLIEKEFEEQEIEDSLWSEARNRVETEWRLARKLIDAGIDTIKEKSGLNGK